MIRPAHNLNQCAEFAATLNQSSKLSFKEKTSLGDTVAKLGQYYKAGS
jgi:hypothetical protein